MAKKKDPSFEEAMLELEKITRDLESGRLPLEESIRSYERGMELRAICLKMLESAEKRLEHLRKREDGGFEKRAVPTEERNEQTGLFLS
jgi:exodeoxyribonuclease VII small subunit